MLVIPDTLARIQEIADLIPAQAVNELGLTGYRISSCKPRFYLGFGDKSIAITEVTPLAPNQPEADPELQEPQATGPSYLEASLCKAATGKTVVAKVKITDETSEAILTAIKSLLNNTVQVGVAKDKKKTTFVAA